MARSLHRPTAEGTKMIAFLNGEIGEDILKADYCNVIAAVNQLAVEQKVAIFAVRLSALTGPQSKKNETVRIAAVRGIVALLPLSLSAIADLLSRCQNKHHYEVHFTLFCYLDWAQEMPDAYSLTANVLPIVENYLM